METTVDVAAPIRQAVRNRQDIFVARQFLSPSECASRIALGEASGFRAAPINTPSGPQLAPELRNNERLIRDDQELARLWWSRCRSLQLPIFGRWRAVGLNERFRFYRYRPGQQFAVHRDGGYRRSADELSWMTLMVYLNEDFDGGETRFYPLNAEPLTIRPQTGMALVFMHDRAHEGAPVVLGSKYVLRTDIMYGRER
jgi:predicted 2-oxoglutarate/Fe(II)-dependent dioxygenase YbiX